MLGGPWLGLSVFIVIAVGLGWGLTKLFQGMADQTRQALNAEQLDHTFDPDNVYVLKRDLLIGMRLSGGLVLAPFKEEMPRSAQGRYSWPTREQYADSPAAYKDSHKLIHVVEAGTKVAFIEIIQNTKDPQAPIRLKTRILTGRHASKAPMLGMHLESADTDDQTGATRYVPHAELFEIIETDDGPIQFEAVDTPEGSP